MQKVLVVEDDATVMSLMRRVLEDERFLVVAATDLDGAWSTLMAEDPDAAMVDLRLAWSESGWDLIERIRVNEHFHDLPIVVVTGLTGDEIVARVRAAKCEYVAKPFSPAALVDRVRLAMRNAGRIPELKVWRVVLLMSGYQVVGNVHCPAELERFSDAWESIIKDPREYIPVTDATVRREDGAEPAAGAPVVEVRKDQVLGAFSAR
jgi:DNA-binding response OmpR family regulator